jgi:sulfur carrier protein ThiS adenylyltransferase
MSEIIGKINPYVKVTSRDLVLSPSNIPAIYENAEVIIECLDRAEAKVMLVETVSRFLPAAYVIYASGIAGFGCNNEIQTRRISDKIFAVGDQLLGLEPGRGLMAPRVGIAAHHQANLAVDLIMGIENSLHEKMPSQ